MCEHLLFFALGYFYVYSDYVYPEGGTSKLPKAIENKIIEFGVKIKINTRINKVIPSENRLMDDKGNNYTYDELIWGADLKTLYNMLELRGLKPETSNLILNESKKFLSKHGGDSVFNLMIGLNEPVSKFSSISNAHFFYTPLRKGLGEINRSRLKSLINNFDKNSKNDVLKWLDEFCELNTYEISIPAIRDSSLAPKGKTGLIVSCLFDYDLIKKVEEAGWLAKFVKEFEKRIIKTLNKSIYKGIDKKIIFTHSFTPLSISLMAGTSEGGITGWSFEEKMPVTTNLFKMNESIKTMIPNVLQAGQWVYSPAGIPTAILTGWHAAQLIIKRYS